MYHDAKFTTVVGEAFLFTFLFQGLGKIRWVAIFNCVAKFLLLPFTFIFVKGPEDYLLAAALPGIVSIVADVMLIVMIAVSGWVSFPKLKQTPKNFCQLLNIPLHTEKICLT